TRSQVGLSLTQRRQNVNGAFRSSQILVAGKTVLVIDDVVTSGATLNACADALWRAGANNVYGLTLARVGFSKK
ncbi:MAG: phosphoribosyltransferase family protein, partial [Chloroflexota bacterium]|nr:phosphoribosyltransferase family protein [Chloroflexota bacterium]